MWEEASSLQEGALGAQQSMLRHLPSPALRQLHDGAHVRCGGDDRRLHSGLKDACQLLPQRELQTTSRASIVCTKTVSLDTGLKDGRKKPRAAVLMGGSPGSRQDTLG